MNSPNNNHNVFFSNSKKKKIVSLLILVLIGFSTNSQEINPNGNNKFFYDTGELASEGNFVNNVPHGIWKTYYKDGTLKSTGLKSNGLSDSIWTFFDKEGRVVWIYEYESDKKNGCAKRYDSTGYLAEEIFYINDVAQGNHTLFFADGKVKEESFFVDGKTEGQLIVYNQEGIIIKEEVYDGGFLKEQNTYNQLNENGQKTGLWRTYYPDGTIKSEINYQNGQMFGIAKHYNAKGKLVDIKDMTSDSTSTLTDIVLLDLYKEYYTGGKIKIVGGLQNGVKSGIYREYDLDGNIVNGFIYENDTMISQGIILYDGTYEGSWKDFYKSGKTKAEGQYTLGVKDGKWIYFYSNGKKEQEGTYRNNLPFGQWIWYYPNGQIQRKEQFNARGNLEGTIVEYDSLGNEIAKGDYYDGLQEGDWFYQVGDFKEVGTFAQGRPTGVWRHYYQNGKLAFVGEFDEGDPKGKHIWYHQNGIIKMSGKYVGAVKHGIWRTYDTMGVVTEEILYKNGEIVKINGFKVEEVKPE